MTKNEAVLRTLAALTVPATAKQIVILSGVKKVTVNQVLSRYKLDLDIKRRPGEEWFYYSIAKDKIEELRKKFNITTLIENAGAEQGKTSIHQERILKIISALNISALPLTLLEISKITGIGPQELKSSFGSVYFTANVRKDRAEDGKTLLYSLSAKGHSAAVSGSAPINILGFFVNRTLTASDRDYVCLADKPVYA